MCVGKEELGMLLLYGAVWLAGWRCDALPEPRCSALDGCEGVGTCWLLGTCWRGPVMGSKRVVGSAAAEVTATADAAERVCIPLCLRLWRRVMGLAAAELTACHGSGRACSCRGQAVQWLGAAVHRRDSGCVKRICKLPAVRQLGDDALSGLLLATEQQSSGRQPKCCAPLRRLLGAAVKAQLAR